MASYPQTRRPPAQYSEELMDYICERIATTTISQDKLHEEDINFPSRKTIYYWTKTYPTAAEKWRLALQARAELYMEEAKNIADDVDPDETAGIGAARVRQAELQVNVREKFARGCDRDKWGTSRIEHAGDANNPIAFRPNLGNLTDDELRMILALAKKVKSTEMERITKGVEDFLEEPNAVQHASNVVQMRKIESGKDDKSFQESLDMAQAESIFSLDDSENE